MNQPRILENTPNLTTPRLILRKYTQADLEDFFLLLHDEEVNTFLPWFTVKTLVEAQEHLENRYFTFYQKASAYKYAICLKSNNKPIGYIGLSDNDSNDLGYALQKKFWQQGIISEAAQALVERLKYAGFAYITATHDVNNPNSGKVMQKIGMTYRYTYGECCQPKNIYVHFRLYQSNFCTFAPQSYMEYWNKYPHHFIEEGLL